MADGREKFINKPIQVKSEINTFKQLSKSSVELAETIGTIKFYLANVNSKTTSAILKKQYPPIKKSLQIYFQFSRKEHFNKIPQSATSATQEKDNTLLKNNSVYQGDAEYSPTYNCRDFHGAHNISLNVKFTN